jgi:hypothetical protein
MVVVVGTGGRYEFIVTGVSSPVVYFSASPWMVASGSSVFFARNSGSWSHSHSISAGEFSVVTSESRATLGDDMMHGHRVAPLIDAVSGVGFTAGTEYAVGTGTKIYASDDLGETWNEAVDLADSVQYTPLPSYVGGVSVLSSVEVAFPTSAGYYVYQSDRYNRQIGSSSMSSSMSSSSMSSSSSSSSSQSGTPWDVLYGGLPDSILEDVFNGGLPSTTDFDIIVDGGSP